MDDFYSNTAIQYINDLTITTESCSHFFTRSKHEKHEHYYFIMPLTGKKTFTLDKQSYSVNGPAQFLFLLPSQTVDIKHECSSNIFLQIKRTSINRIINANSGKEADEECRTNILSTRLIEERSLNIDYRSILKQLFSLFNLFEGDNILLSNIGLDDVIQRTILNILYEGTNEDINYTNIDLSSRSDRSVDILCDAIREFPKGKAMTTTQMQEITGLSSRSLQAAFNRRFGCTPRQWQRNEHLGEARLLLSDRHNIQSVKQIAKQLGFSSSASFSRFYMQRFGELPTETLIKSNYENYSDTKESKSI